MHEATDTSALISLMLEFERSFPIVRRCLIRTNPPPYISSSDAAQLSSAGIVARLNSGALLQFHCGQMDRAQLLCDRALDYCLANLGATDSRSWIEAVFWPYVNIGRLAGTRGYVELGLHVFHDVFAASTSFTAFKIKGTLIEIPRDETRSVFPAAGFIYATESIRCLLSNGLPNAAARFIQKLKDHMEDRALWLELYLLSLMALRRFPEIVALVDRVIANRTLAATDIPFLLARGEANAYLGNTRGAVESLREAEAMLPDLTLHYAHATDGKFNPGYLYLRLAMCAQLAGQHALVADYTDEALRCAESASEISIQIRALIVAMRIGDEAKNSRMDRLRNALAASDRVLDRALGYICLSLVEEPDDHSSSLADAHAITREVNTADSRRISDLITSLLPVNLPDGDLVIRSKESQVGSPHSDASFINLMSYLDNVSFCR